MLTTENHKWFKVVSIKISFEDVDSWAKSLLFRTHHLWNATTELTLTYILKVGCYSDNFIVYTYRNNYWNLIKVNISYHIQNLNIWHSTFWQISNIFIVSPWLHSYRSWPPSNKNIEKVPRNQIFDMVVGIYFSYKAESNGWGSHIKNCDFLCTYWYQPSKLPYLRT